jgi:imidazole glycerol-phosphate synthase subunit HisH
VNRVGLIDSGLCNLGSARRALEECGATVTVATTPADLDGADRVVLPGVGAFADGMASLRDAGFDAALAEIVADGRTPVLGVCLGMQLLAATATEGGPSQGLGLIEADVVRLEPENGERIPHIGWNAVRPEPGAELFAGLPDDADFYFVHSYHVACRAPGDVAATTPYAGGFCSAVAHGLVYGVQFHPEKSQANGFALLRNFLAL